jgi:hypothetical protein
VGTASVTPWYRHDGGMKSNVSRETMPATASSAQRVARKEVARKGGFCQKNAFGFLRLFPNDFGSARLERTV